MKQNDNNSKPSIFTSRDQFNRAARPPDPPPPRRDSPARTPRTSSPFRRQTTPAHRQPHTAYAYAAIAEAEAQADSSSAAPSPAGTTSASAAVTASASAAAPNRALVSRRDQVPSIWASLVPEQTKTRSVSASQATLATPSTDFAPPTTPGSYSRKRPRPDTQTQSAPEPLFKKPRNKPHLKYNLDGLSFGSPSLPKPAIQPPSPLFFSNSPRPRPPLPPRFSSSEAAARMLSKARTEDAHVKTVSLARGTITTTPSWPPTSAPTLANGRSWERSSLGASHSPESLPRSGGSIKESSVDLSPSAQLNSVGILELLEQDERPTFIVDLAESSNYGPGQLHPLFLNSSLRSYEGLQEAVSGIASEDQSPGQNSFLQFKSWLLTASVNGESLNVCLPSFSYNGANWSCSTLRKRLRIISGVFTSLAERPVSKSLTASPAQLALENGSQTALATYTEPADYFGAAAPPPARESSLAISSDVVPSIEATNSRSVSTHARVPGSLYPATPDLSASTNLLPALFMYVKPVPPLVTPSISSIVDKVGRQIALAPSDAPSFDWTRLPITDNMPRHIRFARSIDWAATALGPIENWSSDLRQMCNLIMASPHPAAMYWGDSLVAIYNEAYILLAGQKHPKLMGQSYSEAWSEIWDDVKDVFDSAKETGEATMKDDDCLFIKRNDYLEETYFSWSIIPMVGGDGSVMGLYNPAFEKTRRKIAERRMLTLREIGERTASARDVKGFWEAVIGAFEFQNEYDSPFMLLYSVADEHDSDSSSIHSSSMFSTRNCWLEGSLGIPKGHVSAPDQIVLKTGLEGFGPVFREVMKTDKPAVLEVGSKDLPRSLLEGLDNRGFGDPVRSVVVCPIHPTTGESVLGFLILGVNPRRPYDDDYSLFVQLLSRQLATSLASVVLFEEEIRRGQKAAKLAALDRIELSEQLAQRTQEAIESETKFTRMAEFVPVGMFIAGPDGRITFANDTWYDISRVPKNSEMADTWMNAVKPEDKPLVEQMWRDLVIGTKPVSNEFRFKAQWEDRSGTRGDTWVLFSAYPEKYEDGKLKGIFGSLTNISQQKWAEGIQTRKMEEAVELKRQQENFIDITSHEMRNPLSAILQCSDEISTSLTAFKKTGNTTLPEDLVANCLDAAQTISLCSQHQKRIVDDILTLSKLDSALLLVTPVDSQPLTVVQRALKMHEGELLAADIQMKFVVDQSFKDMNLDWLRFDPSRVLQVLINLTTNAIKFTTTESKRTITVTLAASKEKPSNSSNEPVNYFPTRNKRPDALKDRDWGDGEMVYVKFAVQDTGRGLNPEEKKLLFLRFSQASPRTHVTYGGSGLGLFISRELTELQGGEIGVESEAGKGSTFAFYVAARRSTAPMELKSKSVFGAMATSDSQGKKEPLAMASKPDKHGKLSPTDTAVVAGTKPPVRKVLIVEDNLVNQRVLQKQLKNLGTEVYVANHGGEALEKLMQSTYWACGDEEGKLPPGGKRIELGVVLMDQEMPVMDGLTCTRKIRELEKAGKLTGHVPIIAVTANARAEQIATAMGAGMDDVVSKPFRIPDLVPKIEELMLRYPMPSASSSSS